MLDRATPSATPSAAASVAPSAALAAAPLLDWYDRHARRLPWRVGPAARRRGERADPYRVWLSEVMLQQTTVAAVAGYFRAFTERWPTVADLAAAAEEDVMKAWAGLGYYARARNLKRCAEAVAADHGGRFPESEAALLALPGIGAYTAAAVAAIAFGRPAAVVDGNVERVFSRLYAIATPLPAAKAEIRARVAALVPADRPGEFAEATMDLGATICTPKHPACALCPWRADCRGSGSAEAFPVKAAKAGRPTRRGAAFVAVRADGAVLVRRRPPKGLLGGMTEVPGSEWRRAPRAASPSAAPPMPAPTATDAPVHLPIGRNRAIEEGTPPGAGAIADRPEDSIRADGALAAAPLAALWRRMPAAVAHTFTHFHLALDVYRADVGLATPAPAGMWWSADIDAEALPTVFRKAVAAGLGTAAKRRGG
jgi:A/G-specific adenine glycosylase